MSSLIYQQDRIQLIADRISEGKDPIHGATTIFHDVVIASEMVQKYGDGKALKHRDELEAYAWTADGRWIIAGGHPEEAIISDRKQVSGRTENIRYVKNLKDPKTQRPNRAGVLADVVVFNDKIDATILKDMKAGKKADVSIGFFFTKDAKPGSVEDGPCKGEEYDYVQRNMFHDHLAVGIDNGRCPSPYCGLGADQIVNALANDPFSGFANFNECKAKIMGENPKMSEEEAEGICGELKSKHEKKDMEDEWMGKLTKELAQHLLEELESLRGEKDAKKDNFPKWWRGVDWKEPEMRTIFDHLSPEVQKEITAANDCPECDKAKEEHAECIKLLRETHPDWTEEMAAEECRKARSGQVVKKDDDYDSVVMPHLEKDAVLTSKQRGELPDEAFAYIDPDCKKKDGKTPDSCRHMPIHNKAHVKAALAVLGGAHTGTPPPYADKAKPKVCAAAKKFKIESTVCGKEKDEEKPKVEPKKDTLDPLEVLKRAESVLKSV